MDRRRFLRVMGAAAGAAAGSGLVVPRRARASTWGEFPEDPLAQAAMLPAEVVPKNVLEVFLYGGLSPWETFYLVPEFGKPDDPNYPNEQWYTFQTGAKSVEKVLQNCGMMQDGMPLYEPFAVDANGVQVHVGPFIEQLRKRPDLLGRMRTFVLHHELEPHEAAIPLALAGRPLGNPKMSGFGSAMQYYWQLRTEDPAPAPFSYVLYPVDAFPTDNLKSASAVGMLPASSRPLGIKLEANSTLAKVLARETVGPLRPQYDALVKHYAERYNDRYTWPGETEPVRSKALTDYNFSLATLQNTDKIAKLLTPELLAKKSGEMCGQKSGLDTPGMGMKIAAYLLTQEVDAPRYVCVVDGGLIPASGGGGYDTHDNHNEDCVRNLNHTLTLLTSIINEPGEGDPGKLDLDETLVIITTEFGRTPYAQNGTGRNHNPYGYTTCMLGGPVTPAQKGLVGAIGPDATATHYLTPAEFRALCAYAAGIWPFEADLWAVGDIRKAYSEADAAMRLKAFLGYAS